MATKNTTMIMTVEYNHEQQLCPWQDDEQDEIATLLSEHDDDEPRLWFASVHNPQQPEQSLEGIQVHLLWDMMEKREYSDDEKRNHQNNKGMGKPSQPQHWVEDEDATTLADDDEDMTWMQQDEEDDETMCTLEMEQDEEQSNSWTEDEEYSMSGDDDDEAETVVHPFNDYAIGSALNHHCQALYGKQRITDVAQFFAKGSNVQQQLPLRELKC